MVEEINVTHRLPVDLYRRQLSERFWSKIDVRGPDECWPWMAGKDSHGYGAIWNNKRNELAPRMSWELHNGPIPDGMCVLHHCDNPSYVNPAHLFLGSQADNMRDRDRKGRGAHLRGETNGYAKLTERKVRGIRVLIACGLSMRVIGEKYGVGRRCISMIKTGESWGWLPWKEET